jgi:flagellar protein FlaJ
VRIRDVIVRSYSYLDMPARRYLAIYMSIAFVISFVFIGPIAATVPEAFTTALAIPFLIIAVIPFMFVILWPVIRFVNRGRAIDRDMHLFVTRLGILSLAYVSRKELFNILSEMTEYREIATEVAKVHRLITKWHVSLPRACRIVAAETPSEQFADFLTRLAHAVETGESAETFAQNEQTVAIEEFANKYQGSLDAVEILNEVYVSIVSAMMFIFVIVYLFPLLISLAPELLFASVIVLFVLIEAILLLMLYLIIPGERIWHETLAPRNPLKQWEGTEVPELYHRFWRRILAGFALVIVISVLLVSANSIAPLPALPGLDGFPIIMAAAIALTPLLWPGLLVAREESVVKRRDDNYAAFIRSLGTSAAGMGKETTMALEKLRRYEFGPLTSNISNLHKRLNLRIDKSKGWKLFGAETGSDLISKFNDLYVEGSRVGGNTKEISQIISQNFIKIMGLRKKKFQKSEASMYLYYGITIGVAVTLFVSLVVVDLIVDLSTKTGGLGSENPVGGLPLFQPMPGIRQLVEAVSTFVILAHIVLASLMTRVLGSGHPYGALTHIVLMSWAAAVTMWLTVWAAKVAVGLA